jgi:hypothetical protein
VLLDVYLVYKQLLFEQLIHTLPTHFKNDDCLSGQSENLLRPETFARLAAWSIRGRLFSKPGHKNHHEARRA